VIELRYPDIKSIEHSRNFPWETVVSGAAISVFLLIAPALKPLFSAEFVNQAHNLAQTVTQVSPPWLQTDAFTQFLLPVLPLAIALIIFFWRAQQGYNLYGVGIKPLYLPRQFKDTIRFIRDFQDKLTNGKSV